jgi:hypothetical protein
LSKQYQIQWSKCQNTFTSHIDKKIFLTFLKNRIYSNIYFIQNELLACTKLQTISIELYHIWEAYPMYWCTPIEGLYLLNLEVNSCFGIYLYYVDYAFYIQSECVMLYMCYVIVLLTLYIIINNNIFFNYFSLVLGWN